MDADDIRIPWSHAMETFSYTLARLFLVPAVCFLLFAAKRGFFFLSQKLFSKLFTSLSFPSPCFSFVFANGDGGRKFYSEGKRNHFLLLHLLASFRSLTLPRPMCLAGWVLHRRNRNSWKIYFRKSSSRGGSQKNICQPAMLGAWGERAVQDFNIERGQWRKETDKSRFCSGAWKGENMETWRRRKESTSSTTHKPGQGIREIFFVLNRGRNT